jgi:hypothetical protein
MLDRAPVMISALALLALSAATAACTKSDGPPSGTTSSASTGTTSAPSATVSAATAAPDASPAAADTTTGTAPTAGATDAAAPATASAAASASGAAPKASGSAAGANPELAAANAACGVKPQPDCPLQAWMKTNTNPAIASNDLPALAIALEKTVSFAPPGYTNWASIAKDGAKAAKAGDMTAAKASCRTCHDQYKTKYKADLRGRKI